MWLASAALALLVGAAFTALILAVSAQREAADRETRSKDVTAASLQLEKLVVGRRVELPQLHDHGRTDSLEPYRSARAAARARCASSQASSGRPHQSAVPWR
jgi:Flp pilus assembly protein TadD